MSTAALALPPNPPPAPAVRLPHRFSVDEFYRMCELGFFVGKGRVELIEGEVIQLMSSNPPHDGTVAILTRLLFLTVPAGWSIRIQLSVQLSASAPVPDACLALGQDRAFLGRHPRPPEVGLIIEVADSSLMDDRRDKGRLYAQDRIVEYWIVNVQDRRVEVYTQPSGPSATPTYAQRRDYLPGQSVPLTLGGVAVGAIAVDDLFP